MTIRAWLQEDAVGGFKVREPRRRVSLEGLGATASGDVVPLSVHNISATGMLLECSERLDVGLSLRVDLPEAPDTEAVVLWVSGSLHGCKFVEPLGRATLSAAQLRSAVGTEQIAPPPEPVVTRKNGMEESLGNRLRRLRKARRLTLADLASELGVSKPTVWAWEQDRSIPTQDRHEKIAEVLHTSVADLRTGRDVDAAMAILERSRQQIAESFGVDAAQVRIMIEL